MARRWLGLAALLLHAPPGAATGSTRLLPSLCDGCLAEPVEQDYFRVAGPLGGEPPRLKKPSLAEFDAAARAGQALLIENASDGAALGGWTCEQLAKEFPEAKMRREYDWVKNPGDRNMQTLGNTEWITKLDVGEEAKDRLKQDPEAPPFAPFYWGVREHRNGGLGSEKVMQRVKKLISESVPAFMNMKNGESMFDNAEFWLGAKGTGARAHMDSHCISTLSVVLSGERRWRIGPVPRMPAGAGRSKGEQVVFDDGVAYKLGWKPMFEFTAKAGEAVLFPPGWIHETLNTGEGCTVALTTQFDFPMPVKYYRSYYPRLRRIGDLNPCWGQMMSWAALGEKLKLDKSMKPADARSHAEKLYERRNGTFTEKELDFYDIDGDGKVGRDEFVDTFAAWAATELAVRKEKKVSMPKPDMSLATEAAKAREGEL